MTTDKIPAAVAQAIEAYKPELSATYCRIVRHELERMIAQHGPELRGVSSSWTWARTFSAIVSPVLASMKPATIDEAKLEAVARTYAEEVAATWAHKIGAKLGEIDGATVLSIGNGTFRVAGTRAGKAVSIEQTVVVKRSTRGLVFAQFPARIYVEGKFTSEAAYRLLHGPKDSAA
jgi:hypothetical protein